MSRFAGSRLGKWCLVGVAAGLVLGVVGCGRQAPTASGAEPLVYVPQSARSIDLNNLFEVDPPGGFFMKFQQGPNSTLAVYKTAAGKGRSLPVRINRYNEETGYVVKGSLLFKAGYDGEFTKVLRAGDGLIIPRCVPHSGVFGWDHNEETVLVTTFAEKYVEYGPDDADALPAEFRDKIHYDPDSGVAESAECATMQGAPPVTWTVADLPSPGDGG